MSYGLMLELMRERDLAIERCKEIQEQCDKLRRDLYAMTDNRAQLMTELYNVKADIHSTEFGDDYIIQLEPLVVRYRTASNFKATAQWPDIYQKEAVRQAATLLARKIAEVI